MNDVRDRLTLAWLITIVAIAMFASVCWSLTLPMLAGSDEPAHVDYALAIARDGWPLRGAQHFASGTDSRLRYLERAGHFREMRYDTSFRFETSYGSPAWRAAFDRGAPRDGPSGDTARSVPYVSAFYPPAFYLVAAGTYRVARIVGIGAWEAIHAMRLLGVVALGITLVAAFGVFRRLHLDARTALIATAAVGIFPLTSSVTAAFQPDTATVAAVTIALFCALGIRERPDSIARYLAFACALAAIACCKVHYAVFACVGLLPIVASQTIARPSLLRMLSIVGALGIAAIAVAVNLGVLPHAPTGLPTHASPRLRSPAEWLGDLAAIYVAGAAHDTFWTSRDWIDTAFFPQPALRVVRFALAIASLSAIALVGLGIAKTLGRLGRVARSRPRAAIALACADGPLALYVVWTVGLIVLDLAYPVHIGLLGRYWLPVFVPLVAVLARTFARERGARIVAFSWLAYALAAAPFAFHQMHEQFFGPAIPRSTVARYAQIDRVWDASGRTFDSESIAYDRASPLCFRGLGIDSRYGVPARGAGVVIDGKWWPLRYGVRRADPANTYIDDTLVNVGFEGCVPANALSTGTHDARLALIAKDGTALRWPPHLHLIVSAQRSR